MFRVSVTDKDPSSYIDTGATTHMYSDKQICTYLDERNTKGVTLTNGQNLSTVRIGDGCIKCITGNDKKRIIKLTDVIYVPRLHENLISVNKFTSNGFETHLKNNQCHITRNYEIIVCASEKFVLYEIDLLQQAYTLVKSKTQQSVYTCGTTYCKHRNPKAIQLLAKAQASNFRIKPCDKLKT